MSFIVEGAQRRKPLRTSLLITPISTIEPLFFSRPVKSKRKRHIDLQKREKIAQIEKILPKQPQTPTSALLRLSDSATVKTEAAPVAPAVKPAPSKKPVVVPLPGVPLVESTSIQHFEVTTLPATGISKSRVVAEVPTLDLKPTKEKKVVKAFPSRDGQLKRLVDNCKDVDGHWIWKGLWTGTEPKFSLDGKQVGVREAAFCIYHGLNCIERGFKVIQTCDHYNCLAKPCLRQVSSEAASQKKQLSNMVMLMEASRLAGLGYDPEEIHEKLTNLSPREIDKLMTGHK